MEKSVPKWLEISVIILGILTGILLAIIIVSLFVLPHAARFVRTSSNNYIDMVAPNLQKHLQDYLQLENDLEASINLKYTTTFGQPLNRDRLVLFGKTANDFPLETDTSAETEPQDPKIRYSNLLQHVLRIMYINDSIDHIYDYDDEQFDLRQKLYGTDDRRKRTSVVINGLDTLEDGNNYHIANQLRASILLFIKGYLGRDDIACVNVINSPTAEWAHTFQLYFTKTDIYTFNYSYDAEKGELKYVVINKEE